jgi:hypothetical protein
MCNLYNIVDVTCNIANAEGFGLSNAESMMCGTPVIATVTGGLQDQMNFTNMDGKPMEFNSEFVSNHDGKHSDEYKFTGRWVFPIYPSSRNLSGSPLTPYIFEDYVDYRDVSTGLNYWYTKTKEERKKLGMEGRKWMIESAKMTNEDMCSSIIDNMDNLLNTWTPRKKYTLTTYKKEQIKPTGIIL